MMISESQPAGVRWVLPLLYAGQLAGWPLLAWMQVDNNNLQIAFRILILAASLWVILGALRHHKQPVDTSYLTLYVAIWFALLARLATDTLIDSNGWRPGIEKLYFFSIVSCFIPGLAFLVPLDRSNLARAFYAVYAFAIIAAGFILFQWIASGSSSGMQARLRGAHLGPIDTGNLGATIVILSTYLILRRDTRMPVSLSASAALIGGLFTIGAAASRSPVMATCVCVTLCSLSVLRVQSVLTVGIFLGLFVLAVIFGASYIENELGFAIISRSQGTKYDFHRYELWGNAWKHFVDNPLFGSNTTADAAAGQYPHNIFLECLMANGIFGGLLIAMVIAFGIRSACWLIFKYPEGGWVGLLFVQQLVVMQVTGSVFMAPEFWGLTSGVVAIAYSAKRSMFTSASWEQALPPQQITNGTPMHALQIRKAVLSGDSV